MGTPHKEGYGFNVRFGGDESEKSELFEFVSELVLCESGLVLRPFCSYKEEGNVTKISLWV